AAPGPPSGPSSGSGSATIEPIIDSGESEVPVTPATARPASIARAWFLAMTAGQPPSTNPPTTSSAVGTVSQAVGSSVPCQSNSLLNRGPLAAGAFAPCEIVAGRTAAWRSRRTWRNAEPFGAQTHL